MDTQRLTGVWSSGRGITRRLGRAAFLFFLVKGVAWLALTWALVKIGWS